MTPKHHTVTLTSVALVALILSACTPQPAAPVAATTTAQTTAPETPHPSHDACAPQAELDRMDPRKPVPLQPMMAWHQKQNMQDHLVAIQQITDALARDDWDAIARAASRIEASPQMQRMCQHMGAGAEGFTPLALDFHKRAEAIAPAARAKDAKAVLKATAHTLAACTSCHATYRQEIVSAEVWQQRTGSTHGH